MFYFLGSLAKGTSENVASLVDLGVVGVLVDTLRPNTDPRLTEACLCALRSIFMHPPAPSSIIQKNSQLLSQLLSEFLFFIFKKYEYFRFLMSYSFSGVAQNGTLVGKSCVARLLSVWCTGKTEQEALAEAGACAAAAALLASATPPSPLTLPTLDWLAAMCFENPTVARTAAEAQ